MLPCDAVRGGGAERESNGARCTLCRISVTPSTPHNQIGPLWCWSPSGWACARSRLLWVSPRNSPVRLGFLLLLPQSTQVFSIRGLRLYFPELEPWAARSASLPAVFPVYLRECGAAGSASGQTACPVHPTLHQSQSHRGITSPLCPGCPAPPLLPVWMNVYFLSPWCQTSSPFDFLSVLVVRVGAVCLPMLPSWFSQNQNF